MTLFNFNYYRHRILLKLIAKDCISDVLFSLAITVSLDKSSYNYLLRENGTIMRKWNKNSI